ncbi:MAG TPA: biotin-dependent carboxyltransferase family protein [Opitutus sp.]|nr:biotin-dependent carboxyltransferase family protein [Opitutus sp.]
MKIVRAGMQTTVQDLGRHGHRAEGVPRAGAMDTVALRIANALVGNDEGAAGLEFTLVGPEIELSAPGWIALGGADVEGAANWAIRRVGAGERVVLGRCVRGCRGYLAVSGGSAVPDVRGSASTYLRGGFGGAGGRALREGDVLRTGPAHLAGDDERWRDQHQRWRIDPRVLPSYSSEPVVRVVLGAQAEEFAPDWMHTEFTISPQSDRMGVRLTGEKLARAVATDLLSAAVMPGTVQVPPDGQPVILMADAQTIGGYPQLAHVITVDLPLVAQARPGDRMRFAVVPLREAQRLLVAREHAMALLKQGLAEKLKNAPRAS